MKKTRISIFLRSDARPYTGFSKRDKNGIIIKGGLN